MPLYDYCCYQCDHTWEVIEAKDNNHVLDCPKCGYGGRRIISIHGANCANEDADWIKSVTEVVPKDSNIPAEREFLRNPTRSNMKEWMKVRGLRHMESGEKPRRPTSLDDHRITRQLMERHMERNRLEVHHASKD